MVEGLCVALGTASADDEALVALASLLAFHRIAVDPSQVRHGLGHNESLDADMLDRVCKSIDGVRTKAMTVGIDKIARQPLPALASTQDGGWMILSGINGDKALIQRIDAAIEQVSLNDLARFYGGTLLLVTTRESVLKARASSTCAGSFRRSCDTESCSAKSC